VTEVVDTFEDNMPRVLPPVTIENILGNHVIVRIAPHRYVLFAHLKQHSIRVRLHERVKTGAVLGEVGNSGNSTGAHLHMQVMTASSALASEGVPFVFEHFRFLGDGQDFVEDKHANEPRVREMPVDDEVIRFH
jgi:murein DD-endopeptidase MepM/ murein hydrolase activator NlpD